MGHLSGWDKQIGFPCLRRSGFAQAGQRIGILTRHRFVENIVFYLSNTPFTLPNPLHQGRGFSEMSELKVTIL